VPSTTPETLALARELKRRGFRFVGPTTLYALMQACGLVNDHLAGCSARPAVERARRFLDAERTRVVHSSELEPITGLTRYDLARQFRIMLGTSPHRYLLMRRLAFARDRIHQQCPLVDVACEAGFADQAHFTRAFKSAFGLTPARYRALRAGPAELTGRRPVH